MSEEQQQPVEVMYPIPTTRQTSTNTSTHADGSFGPVFIVLAVIIVISAVACVLGRICSRKHSRVKEGGGHNHNHNKQSNKAKNYKHDEKSHGLGPKEWESRQKPSFNMSNGDIEFGFEKKKPSSKMGMKSGGGGGGKGHKPEVRFAENV